MSWLILGVRSCALTVRWRALTDRDLKHHVTLSKQVHIRFSFTNSSYQKCCDLWVRMQFLHKGYALVILTLVIISVEVVIATVLMVNSPPWQGVPTFLTIYLVPRLPRSSLPKTILSMRIMMTHCKLVPSSQPPELAESKSISSPGQALKYWEKCKMGAKSGSLFNFSGSSSVTLY